METIESKQGIIKFEWMRSGNLRIAQNPTSEDRECIYVSKSEALTLAKAIIERCGEWMPIEGAPVEQMLWLKNKSGKVIMQYYVKGDYDIYTHYQPIIKPKT